MSFFSRNFERSFHKISRANFQSQLRRRRQRAHLQLECLESRRLLTFAPAIDIFVETDPQAVVAADFNNDGHVDLATTGGNYRSRVSVRLGDGAGGFGTAREFSTGMYLSSIAVADFNEDTNLDLVVGGFDDNVILLGNGDGSFQPAADTTWGGQEIIVGDFNNDSHVDLLTTFTNADWLPAFNMYLGNGQAGFTELAYNYLQAYGGLVAVHLNDDADLDLLIANAVLVAPSRVR